MTLTSPEIMPTREHADWTGKKSAQWNEEIISQYDVAVISTNHQAYNLQQLADWSDVIVDTRNAMKDITGTATVLKA